MRPGEDDERAKGAKLTISNSVIVMPDGVDVIGNFAPTCDYNSVVADKPYPEIQGPNGRFFASVEELKLGDFTEGGTDVRPQPDSPLIGTGRDGATVGPYEPGDPLLPRPLENAWTDALPAAWTRS